MSQLFSCRDYCQFIIVLALQLLSVLCLSLQVTYHDSGPSFIVYPKIQNSTIIILGQLLGAIRALQNAR